jgi:3-oxoadipate enol-lactonase
LLSDRNVFTPIVPVLGKSYRMNLVDLPGFGSTTLIEPDMNSFADLIGALLAAGDYDPSTTTLLGNGLGAFVALGVAIRHGDSFNRLIVAGCGAGFTEAGMGAFQGMIKGVEAGGMAAIAEVAIRRIFPEDYLTAHPDQAEERRTVLQRTSPEAFIAACGALLGLDYRDEATRVANPTLVIAGSEDQATPPSLAIDLAERIPGARLEIMEGVAHAPQLQDPDGFVELVRGFLAE